MLIPFFFGLKNLANVPVSLFFLVFMISTFFLSSKEASVFNTEVKKILYDPVFYHHNSYLYTQWLRSNAEVYDSTTHRVSDLARSGDTTYRMMLSQMALKDARFQREIFSRENLNREIASVGYSSNTLETSKWLELSQRLNGLEKGNLVYNFGFISAEPKWYTYFTYQFIHSNLLHFAMNGFFFLLLAPLVELIIGSLVFSSFFLLGGAFAAYFYSQIAGETLMPLIGASGSICFLMGFICMYYGRHKFYYFFWLLPIRGYYGFIALPAYIALVIWLLSDLAGQLSAGPFQHVAYSAHIGGLLLGALVGYLWRNYFGNHKTLEVKAENYII